MSDYISREAFLEKERRLYCQDCSLRKNSNGKLVYEIGDAPCRACGIGDVLDDFEDIPAADVRPVVHGTWKQFQEPDDGGPLSEWLSQFPSFECSECGYKFLKIYDAPKNFCPNCGADMRGESDV